MFRTQRRTLHDDILSHILDWLHSGRLKPGDKLPGENALAAQFSVSRNCIREVLKALALANVVVARQGRGTFVTDDALERIGPRDKLESLRELKEMRDLLEGHAAYLAAKNADDGQIERLRLSLVPTPGENITEGHAGFHKVLHETAGNRMLTRLLASVQKEMDELRAKYNRLPSGVLSTYSDEHMEIYRMVKEHKPDEARDAMQRHIDAAWADALYEGLMQIETPI